MAMPFTLCCFTRALVTFPLEEFWLLCRVLRLLIPLRPTKHGLSKSITPYYPFENQTDRSPSASQFISPHCTCNYSVGLTHWTSFVKQFHSRLRPCTSPSDDRIVICSRANRVRFQLFRFEEQSFRLDSPLKRSITRIGYWTFMKEKRGHVIKVWGALPGICLFTSPSSGHVVTLPSFEAFKQYFDTSHGYENFHDVPDKELPSLLIVCCLAFLI